MSTEQVVAPPKAPAQVTPEAGAKVVTPPAVPPPAGAGAVPPKVEPPKAGEAPPKVEEKKPDGTAPTGEIVYDLKLPEGSPLKPENVEAVKAWAKEQGLSVKQAQAQLDRESKAQVDRTAAEQADLDGKRAVWKKATLDHPELGGANLVRTTGRTKAALTRFDKDGSLTKVLETSGLGDLPAVVSYLESIGAALESDKFVVPPVVPVTGEKAKDESVFYGTKKG